MIESIKNEIKNILSRHSAFDYLGFREKESLLSNETLILDKIIASDYDVEKKSAIITDIYKVHKELFNSISDTIYENDYDIEYQPLISAEYYDDQKLTLTKLLVKLTMQNYSQSFNSTHPLYDYLARPRNNSSAVLQAFIDNGMDVNSINIKNCNCIDLINHKAQFEFNDEESQNNITQILNVAFNNGFRFSKEIDKTMHPLQIFAINKISVNNLRNFYKQGYPEISDEAKYFICLEQYLKSSTIDINTLITQNIHNFIHEGINAYTLIAGNIIRNLKKNISWNEQDIKDILVLSENNVDIKGLVPIDERSLLLSRNNISFLNFFINSGMAEKDPETLVMLINNSNHEMTTQFNSTINFTISHTIIALREHTDFDNYVKLIQLLQNKNYHLQFDTIASIKNNVNEDMLEELELISHNFYDNFFNYINRYEKLNSPFIRHEFEKILNYMGSTLEKEIEYLETSKYSEISSYWQKHALIENMGTDKITIKQTLSRL